MGTGTPKAVQAKCSRMKCGRPPRSFRATRARLYTQSVAARYEKLFPIFALGNNQRPRLGYMDFTGKTIIAPRFSFGLEFLEGRAPVQVGKKWRFINDSGAWAFSGEFGNAERFSEGLAYVIAAPRKYGFIDVNGNMAVEPKYRWVAHFAGGAGARLFGEVRWLRRRPRHRGHPAGIRRCV